jgi:hypothetical protein
LRLDLGRGRLGIEALVQGHGCHYLRWSDGAQLGVEPIREQRLERRSAGGIVDADMGVDSARKIREYFIFGFSNWKNHDEFEATFAHLLKDLKASA